MWAAHISHAIEFNGCVRCGTLDAMTPGWCVRVSVFDDLVVSISDRELCGRDLSEADKTLIRGCARHLLSFVGD